MALGTIVKDSLLEAGLGPVRLDEIHFPGDGAYPAGGTPGFEALVRAKLVAGNVDVIAIIQIDASGYVLRYDKANDKLMVFESDNGGADGPLQQTTTADLSGTTFRVIVLSR